MPPDGDKRPRSEANLATVLFRDLPSHPKLSAQDKRELKEFAQNVSKKVTGAAAFLCLITNDNELRRLNLSFLDHDFPTDVLSFPAGPTLEGLGEIAISLERAQAQAEEVGHSCLDEVRILMLHGALHISGFDHESDRGEMARAERKWRATFGLPSTLIARSKARLRSTTQQGALHS